MKVWLTLTEAADVANRSERTIRNWVRDGVLQSRVGGRFARDEVLRAEQAMRNRVGRPTPSAPSVVRMWGETWAEVTACGAHRTALAAGLVAISCKKCRIQHVPKESESRAGG